ncbi:hypothetical protein VNO77_12470 [Canavalia gladiata]|uniref:Uncharacterized protein n=1 Tax=Canavalia gladiata TaxID=3824 RepID=A0AAN9LXE2_CANGL
MGNKFVALLLVVCLVFVGGVEAMDMIPLRVDCIKYCTKSCVLSHEVCKWWCKGRCRNPTLLKNPTELMEPELPDPGPPNPATAGMRFV